MFKESKFYLGWQKLLKDLKPMTFPQKIDHLWTYYKEVLWVASLVILMLTVIIASLFNSNKEVLVSGMMVNITIDQEGFNYLDSDYFAELGGDPKKHVDALVEYSNFGDLADPTNHEDNSTQAMILIARVEGQYMDYGLIDQMALEYYLPMECFMDLRELFTTEELTAMGNKVIWAREENSEEALPLAIDISDVDYVKDNIEAEDGKVYFVLGGRTTRLEMCRQVWDRIHAWEKEQ